MSTTKIIECGLLSPAKCEFSASTAIITTGKEKQKEYVTLCGIPPRNGGVACKYLGECYKLIPVEA